MRFNTGFTLIELLIVMAVVGILTGGLITLINPVTQLKKSRDAKVKANIAQIQTALELYRADCGKYPSGLTAGESIAADSTCTGAAVTYMQTIPSLTNFNYRSDSPYTTYTLSACLENEKEPADAENVETLEVADICASKKLYKVSNP